MIIEVASSDILEEEVDAVFILEDKVHAQHKRVVGLEQNVLLVFSVLNLVLVNEHILVDPLHGIQLTIDFIDYQKHLPK